MKNQVFSKIWYIVDKPKPNYIENLKRMVCEVIASILDSLTLLWSLSHFFFYLKQIKRIT